MTKRRTRSQTALALKAAEVAWAAPQVITQRLSRMAVAGARPTAADKREMHRMGAEKSAAFFESWAAMGFEALRWQQKMVMSMMTPAWLGGGRAPNAQRTLLSMMGQGLAPVHRRVTANARRLRKR
jgi:hypothetical protein